MATVVFIGLGVMGAPMACNLAKAGHDVVGLSRSHNAAQLIACGGRTVDTLTEALAQASFAVTMVPDGADVQSVAIGPQGIYANAPDGLIHIDCSTIQPDTARQLSQYGRQLHVEAVDAPVSGGEAAAKEATLSIMVGGTPGNFERVRPILEVLGSNVVHVGQAGSGQIAKAANQLIVAGTLELLSEAIVFLQKHDVDVKAALKVISGGLAGSTVLNRKAAGMVERRFDPGFRIDLHHKDMGILLSAARDAGVAIPLGSHVADLLSSIRAQGHGSLDHSALLLQVEALSRISETGAP